MKYATTEQSGEIFLPLFDWNLNVWRIKITSVCKLIIGPTLKDKTSLLVSLSDIREEARFHQVIVFKEVPDSKGSQLQLK